MITAIYDHTESVNYLTGYYMEDLTEEELELAKYFWIKGWNAFMAILPNITPDELLTDDNEFPYNREYTDSKEPLVRYFSKGLDNFRINKDE